MLFMVSFMSLFNLKTTLWKGTRRKEKKPIRVHPNSAEDKKGET